MHNDLPLVDLIHKEMARRGRVIDFRWHDLVVGWDFCFDRSTCDKADAFKARRLILTDAFRQREKMKDYDDRLFLNIDSDVFYFRESLLSDLTWLRQRIDEKGILLELKLKGYIDD